MHLFFIYDCRTQVRYLEENNWKVDFNFLNGLLSEKYAESDKSEFYSVFSKTVQEDTKELIYRLDFIIGDFSDNEISLVSSIEPQVIHPFEKLNQIINIWIQKNKGKYSLSPLIKKFGKRNLLPNTIRQVNLQIGYNKLKKKILNQQDALEAILYFSTANEYNEVAQILIKFYISFLEIKDQKIDDFGISLIWLDQPLPEDMDLDLKLIIRSLQLKVNEKLGNDIDYLLEDLNILIEHADNRQGIGLIAVALTLPFLHKRKDLNLFYKYFIKSLNAKKLYSSIFQNLKVSFESLMWLVIVDIKTTEHFFDWFNVVEEMPIDSREVMFASEISIEASVILIDKIWHNEASKVSEKQNWQYVLKQYDDLESRTKALNIELLWCCVIRAKIIVLSEYLKKTEEAIQIGKKAVNEASKESVIQYILKDIIAKEYLFNEKYDEADEWFKTALNEKIESLHFQRVLTLFFHSEALSHIDLDRAVKICNKGVEFAKKYVDIISTNMLILAYGECAVMLFKKFGVIQAFDPFEKGIELLFASEIKDKYWRELFVIYGHVSGYLTSIAISGKPPEKTIGGYNYLAPEIGMFLNRHKDIGNWYNSSRDHIIPIQVSSYAGAIANDEKARKWGLKAYNFVEDIDNCKEISIIIDEIIIPDLIINKKYADAIILGKESYFQKRELTIKNVPNYQPGDWLDAAIFHNCLIPMIALIGHLKIVNDFKKEDLNTIIKDIEGIASSFDLDESKIFESIIDILKFVFSEETTYEDIVRMSNNYINEKKQWRSIFCAISVALKDNIKPEWAIQAHLAILGEVHRIYSKFYPFIYRQIIIPFFKAYWQNTFTQNKFRFTAPRLVEQNLNNALNFSSEIILLKIMEVISDGLNFNLSESVKRCFENNAQKT